MADRLPRFGSEFGFQSFPEMKTIRTFATEDDFDINSDAMKIHQNSLQGILLLSSIWICITKNLRVFKTLYTLVLSCKVTEWKRLQKLIDVGRTYCMGALYWQINDNWPVVSLSSIDYYNNWKSQHYKMRNVFAPLALGVQFRENKISYYTMSDYLYDAKSLTLNVQVIGFNGKRLRNLKEKINATANTSEVVKVYNVEELVTEKHLYMYVI